MSLSSDANKILEETEKVQIIAFYKVHVHTPDSNPDLKSHPYQHGQEESIKVSETNKLMPRVLCCASFFR